MNNVSLSIMKTRDTELAETIFENDLAQKYSYGLNGIELKKVQEFLDAVKKEIEGAEFFSFIFSKNGSNKVCHITNIDNPDSIKKYGSFHMAISIWNYKRGYMEIFGDSIKTVADIYSTFSEFLIEGEENYISYHSYFVENALTYHTDTMKEKDFEDLDPNYFPDFSSTNLFFEDFLKAKENIVVLSGPTGIGKSKFSKLALKHALENIHDILTEDDISEGVSHLNVAYVKNEQILSNDSFWIRLKKGDYSFVILDDLDYYLSPRSQTVSSELEIAKDKFISELLSFSDGILGNRVKFIISTNREISSIDEALLREGRMFGVFEFSQLSEEEAKAIWISKGLCDDSFDLEFGGRGEVLQSALGSRIHSYLKNNGKKRPAYLKAGSKADISLRYAEKKRVGLI